MSINKRERQVITGEDAKRFLEEEKKVDELRQKLIERYKNDPRSFKSTERRHIGIKIIINKDLCLAQMGVEYLNKLQEDEKYKDLIANNFVLIYDLINDYSVYLEEQLGLCASHPGNKDNIDREE